VDNKIRSHLRLLCKRLEVSGPTVREARPVWSAEHRSTLGHDFTLVARALGSDLGGLRLTGFGCLGIAKLRPSSRTTPPSD
jgi:hypothetical protein